MGEGGRNYSEKGEVDTARRRAAAIAPAEKVHRVKAGEDGTLRVPPELARKLGLAPGAELELVARGGDVEIRPNIHSLNRLYVEPTSRCNLSCRTCVRNTWDEPLGDMDMDVFRRLAGQLRGFPHLESVMFGGFGEPTAHPGLPDMVRSVKAAGLRAEVTTNGTRLDDALIDGFLAERLDTLWISLDGADAESYESIRAGSSWSRVLGNVERLARRNGRGSHEVDVGIAFVVMRSNLDDLKRLEHLARMAGARRILVSHVLPYTEAMEKEMLCLQTLSLDTFTEGAGKTEMSIPRFDINNTTKDAVIELLKGFANLTLTGNRIVVAAPRCRFVHDRATFVRWDGRVAPCMGLLHSHRTFLYGLQRSVRSHAFGDVRTGDLLDIWNSPGYAAFREKVRAFEYSPCYVCGGCQLLEKNEEDCFGSAFPACGGCLWAQGIIQCP